MSLAKRPFYYLTDRETLYTKLVTPKGNFICYPNSYEPLTQRQVRRKKAKLIAKMLFWSVLHPQSMTGSDYRICLSRVIDITSALVLGLIGTDRETQQPVSSNDF